jgi:putative SOS response-associated peptidase YedK
MCGRFFLSSSGAEVARELGLDVVPELAPRFNVAPGQLVPVVRARRSVPGARVLELCRWGFVPAWAREPAEARPHVNARVETAGRLPAFRDAAARRRGLVPADGFYEWQHRGRSAAPFAVRVEGRRLFTMACLFEGDTCAILTTEANERVRPVHDRMPVIVAPADRARWLEPDLHDFAALADVTRPWPAVSTELQRVGHDVNDPRAEGPALLEPVRDLFSP